MQIFLPKKSLLFPKYLYIMGLYSQNIAILWDFTTFHRLLIIDNEVLDGGYGGTGG